MKPSSLGIDISVIFASSLRSACRTALKILLTPEEKEIKATLGKRWKPECFHSCRKRTVSYLTVNSGVGIGIFPWYIWKTVAGHAFLNTLNGRPAWTLWIWSMILLCSLLSTE